ILTESIASSLFALLIAMWLFTIDRYREEDKSVSSQHSDEGGDLEAGFPTLASRSFRIIETIRQLSQKQLILGLLIAVTALWSFTRDANAYFVLGLAGILILGLIFKNIRKLANVRHYLILITAFVAIFIIQVQSADVY